MSCTMSCWRPANRVSPTRSVASSSPVKKMARAYHWEHCEFPAEHGCAAAATLLGVLSGRVYSRDQEFTRQEVSRGKAHHRGGGEDGEEPRLLCPAAARQQDPGFLASVFLVGDVGPQRDCFAQIDVG